MSTLVFPTGTQVLHRRGLPTIGLLPETVGLITGHYAWPDTASRATYYAVHFAGLPILICHEDDLAPVVASGQEER